MRIGFIISLVFAIIVALFSIQNAAVIPVNFFSTTMNISLALVIFVSAIIGAIIVTLFGVKKEFLLNRGNKRLSKKAEDFQGEVETYRSENLSLRSEKDNFKKEREDLEAKNKSLSSEIAELNIEIKRLNTISSTKTIF